jgi:hypothetical protein
MKKFIQGLLGLLLIACLVLPASIVYAEVPITVEPIGVSNISDEGIGSPFQHHSFTENGSDFVFYLDNVGNQIDGMWSDNGVVWAALTPIHFCNGSLAATEGGQFDSWYDPSTKKVHFAVVNLSTNNSPILYAKYDVNPSAHTLTINGSWVTAVAGVANVSYRNPTICVNKIGYPFITYGYVYMGSSDVYLTMSNSTTVWTPQAGMPMHNLSQSINWTWYGSVIPLAIDTTNVSVQWVGWNGSVSKDYQAYVQYNGSAWNLVSPCIIDTSNWYCPSGYEWNYNAVSIRSAVNDNDIAFQAMQTNGSTYLRIFFNRMGAYSPAEWDSTWARNFGQGETDDYMRVGAMGIRNDGNDLVYSCWNELDFYVWSNDYDLSTGNWDGLTAVYDDTADVPYYSTMANYQYDWNDTGDTGFIMGSVDDDQIVFGRYGPATPTPPSSIPTSVTMMAWIVVLVFGALICLILLAYGASEAIKGGNTEFIKIGLVGFITFVIAAIIVANTLV